MIRHLFFLIPASLMALSSVFSQDFWQPSTGPYGGQIQALTVNSSGYLFAGGSAGVYRSMDNGGSWAAANSGLANAQVQTLAISSTGQIYAGTGSGVFRSTDNGGSWTAGTIGLANTPVNSLAINSSGHVFAGVYSSGVFRSTDNGGSWTAVNSGLTAAGVQALAINSSGFVFAGSYGGGVFRSTNSGGSWTAVNYGLSNTYIVSLAINSSGYLFAGTNGGVYRSTDNGGSWTAVNSGMTDQSVFSLAINSSGYVFAGSSARGVYRSTDNGGSWTAVSTGVAGYYAYSLATSASGLVFAGTSGGGVYRSTDSGGSWTAANGGLRGASLCSLAINSSGHVFAGTYYAGVYRSTDNGGSWTAVNSGLANTYVVALAINSSGYVFAGTYGGGVFRSTDNGGNWLAVNGGLANANVLSLAINSAGYVFAGTYGGGVYRSTDNGVSWTVVNSGLTSSSPYSLAINSSGYVFAGTYGSGIYRSTDNGGSWLAVNSGLTNTYVQSLAINSSGYIFAGTNGGGVFRSTDNGGIWTAANSGLTNTRIQSAAINSSGHVFAGTFDGGVYRSTNNGGNWTAVNSGLTNTYVSSLAINAAGDVFAGTTGGGVFKSLPATTQDLVQVTGGTFQMGSNDANDFGASPPHSVTLGAFSIDRTEITYEKWTDVRNWGLTHGYTDLPAGGNGYTGTGANHPVTQVRWYDVLKWCNARSEKDGLTPVYYTSNTLAIAYRTGEFDLAVDAVKWTTNGYRLPTEAEWEFAARGGTKSKGYTYSGSNNIDSVSWYVSNSGSNTHPVSSKGANELGLYDMSGNVYEWCWDWEAAYVASAQTDPKGPTSGSYRVLRGASFFYQVDCRVASRGHVVPGTERGDFGFRCVQAVPGGQLPPTVSTTAASNVSSSSVTLNGSVNPNGLSATAYFEWGTSSTLSTSSTTASQSIGSGTSAVSVTANLTGLSPSTTYYFRAVGQNSAGTQKGSIFSFVTAAATPAGNSLVLNGTTAYASVPDAASLRAFGQALTVEAWVKREVGGDNYPRILDKNQYSLIFDGTGKWQKVIFNVSTSSGSPQLTSNRSLRAGVWNHIAGVYDGSKLKLYINGVLDNSTALTGSVNTGSDSLRMGRYYHSSAYYLKGQLDEVRVWNVARDSLQIQNGMSAGLAGNEAGLAGYWRLDESSGTTTSDATVNGNSGVLRGGASFGRPNALPVAPVVYAKPGSGMATLSWTPSVPATATQYRIYRWTGSTSRQLITNVSSSTTSYTDSPLTNDSTYYYQMTAVDGTGAEGDYSLQVAVTPHVGVSGNGILFNGTSSSVAVADDPALRVFGQAFTIEAWVKREIGGDGYPRIVDKNQYSLIFDGTGKWQKVIFNVSTSSGSPQVTSNRSLRAGVWNHIAGVYDGSKLKLYINGVLDNSTALTGSVNTGSDSLRMGRYYYSSYYHLKGQMDEVRVWNVARDSLQIQNGMVSGLTGNEAGLAGYWRLDESSGATTYDATASGNNGVLRGGASFGRPNALPVAPVGYAKPGNGRAILSWTPSSITAATQFRVYRWTGSTSRQLMTSVTGSTTSYTDSPLTNDTTYYYQIAAVDAAGAEGDFSSLVAATPHASLNGNGIFFDGTGGYVAVADDPALRVSGQALTVEAWVKREIGGDGSPRIVDKNQYSLMFDGTGKWQKVIFYLSTSTGAPQLKSNRSLSAGIWNHIAGVYDGTQMKLYINGVMDNTVALTGNVSTGSDSLKMGRYYYPYSGNYLKGQLDEVRVWNVARDSQQIQNGIVSGLTGNEPGLAGYWRLDESTGTTTHDATVNGNNGMLRGGASFVRSNIPPVPVRSLEAAASGSKVSLKWSPVVWPNLLRYRIYRRLYTDEYFAMRDSTLASITTFTDSVNLKPGLTYYYMVRALDDAFLESDTSNIVFVTMSGGTTVLADINSNTTWTKGGSPYRVIQNISIGSSSTLTIEPGVVVQLDLGVSITVNGALRAIGTRQDSIRFTSLQPGAAPSQWKSLVFSNKTLSPGSELRYCIVEFGGSGYSSAISSGTSGILLQVGNSLIWKNYSGIYLAGTSSDSISHSTVVRNTDYGINVSGSVVVHEDSVAQNGGIGINAQGSVIGCSVSNNGSSGIVGRGTLRGNIAWSNKYAGIDVNGQSLVDSNIVFRNSGGGISATSNVTLRRNLIYENTGSSGVFNVSSSSTVENNTVVKNAGGITNVSASSNVVIRNNIVAFNSGNGMHTTVSPAPLAKFNNVFSNTSNWNGFSVVYGNLTGKNLRGDAADAFMNIGLDPQFADTLRDNFFLTKTSHMIDAGDSLSSRDPDSTTADLGAFYFDQAPPSGPPTLSTASALNVTSVSATVSGTVNPNGSSAVAFFEWGTSSSLSTSNTTASQSIGSGRSAVTVTANLTGLSPKTTYYYRVVGQNTAGSQRGTIANFTTSAQGLGEYAPDANTVLLLHMNETSGSTVSDASSAGNNGAATGTTIRDGRFGKARSFNGTADFVQGSSSSFNFTGQNFTLEAWINTSSGAGQGIFVTNNSNVGLYLAGGSSPGFFDLDINNGQGTSTSNFSGRKVNDGKWHHVAGVRNGSQILLYVDGTFDFQKTATQNPNNSTAFFVGTSGAGSMFNGLIDEVRISNKARLPQEFNLQLPPRNLSASLSGLTANLSWQNGGGAVGLLRYKIYRGTDSTSVTLIDSTTSTSYSNAGLSAATTYYYRVSATDSTGFEGAKSYAAMALIPAPLVSVSPSPLAFDTVTVGTSRQNTLTVSNTGTSTLTVSSVSSSNAAFAVPGVGFSVGPGSSTPLTVTFSPTSQTAYSGTITITHNASGSPTVVNVSGSGTLQAVPQISVPATLAFGAVNVSTNSQKSLSVTNTGSATLSVSTVQSNNGAFTVPSGSFTVAPGNSVPLVVTFSPSAVTSYQSTISISHNAAGGPSVVTVTGTGTAAPAPLISVSASTIAFGNVNTGSSLQRTFTVGNSGTATLNVTNIVSNDAAFSANPSSFNIASGGGAQTVTVTFSPSAARTYSATLSVTHNASGSPSPISLTGTGTGSAVISLQQSTIPFGTVNVGSSASQTLNVTNSGNIALNVTNITSSNSSFAVSPTSFTLSPGASQTLTVTFTPLAGGSLSSSLVFVSNAATSPTFTLSGTGQTRLTSSSTQAGRFSAGIPPSTWVLLSVPYTLDNPGAGILSPQLSGQSPWVMYTYQNGQMLDYSQQGNAFSVTRGLWFKTIAKSASFSLNFGPGDLIGGSTYSMTVPTGWSLVGPPFHSEEASWSPVNTTPGSSGIRVYKYLHENNAGWQLLNPTVERMKPYGGYAVYNGTGASATFTFVRSGPLSDYHEWQAGDGWYGVLAIGETKLRIGQHRLASAGEDGLDYPMPPARPEAQETPAHFAGNLWSDIRPEGLGEVLSWKVVIDPRTASFIKVTDRMDIPEGVQIVVQGIPYMGPVDMTSKDSIALPTTMQGVYTVNVLVGNAESIAEKIRPQEPMLLQNYPNPFNPTTSIRYQIASESAVSLRIFNSLGEEIRTLVNGPHRPGFYEVQWDGRNAMGSSVSSGIYYCVLNAGGYVAAAKVVLLK